MLAAFDAKRCWRFVENDKFPKHNNETNSRLLPHKQRFFSMFTKVLATLAVLPVVASDIADMSDEYLQVVCSDEGFMLHIGCNMDCSSCLETRTGTSITDCFEEGHDDETHYVDVNCAANNSAATIRVHKGANVTGCDSSATEIEIQEVVSQECVIDEHGHNEHAEHEEEAHISVSCNSGGSFSFQRGCDEGCSECEDELTGSTGQCYEESHDGEVEFIRVDCDGTVGGNVSVYTSMASCEAALDGDTDAFDSGVCYEDEHGHSSHGDDDVDASAALVPCTLVFALAASTWM